MTVALCTTNKRSALSFQAISKYSCNQTNEKLPFYMFHLLSYRITYYIPFHYNCLNVISMLQSPFCSDSTNKSAIQTWGAPFVAGGFSVFPLNLPPLLTFGAEYLSIILVKFKKYLVVSCKGHIVMVFVSLSWHSWKRIFNPVKKKLKITFSEPVESLFSKILKGWKTCTFPPTTKNQYQIDITHDLYDIKWKNSFFLAFIISVPPTHWVHPNNPADAHLHTAFICSLIIDCGQLVKSSSCFGEPPRPLVTRL